MKRICLFLFIFFTCATISYADLTSLSKKASQLKMGMSLKSVIALLGEPDWLILSSDTGSYKDAVPPNLYQVMWSNNDCVPVAIHFDISNSKATGWDEGRWLCGSSAKSFTPSPQYSLDQKNRREFLNSKLGFQGNEIKELEAKIRKIPASKIEENLLGYQQLLQLDPLNKKYKQKVIYYESKLSKKNKKSTLDMINSPLEQLNAELTGKTERQITAIVGRPAKTVEFGNNMYMWVYGNTNTSKDRCILFQNGKASGVSFW